MSLTVTLSLGLFGPLTDETTVPRSSLNTCENTGLASSVLSCPVAFKYASITCSCLSGRPAGEILSQIFVSFVVIAGVPTCLSQVDRRGLVEREEADRGPVLGAHVGYGGPVSDRQGLHPGAEELDELSDHSVLAQVLQETFVCKRDGMGWFCVSVMVLLISHHRAEIIL